MGITIVFGSATPSSSHPWTIDRNAQPRTLLAGVVPFILN